MNARRIGIWNRSGLGTAASTGFSELIDLTRTGPSKDTGGVIWPKLEHTGLDRKAVSDRKAGIGGSDANVIMGGDNERLLRLWAEKRGEQAPEDLSEVLPVQLGQWTEAFNRQWYERGTGFAVTDVGMMATCSSHGWRRATIDGYVSARRSVWEAKHVNAFAKSEDVLSRYMPQLQHNMAVIGVSDATLSVIYGNHRWEVYEIASDWLYQDELLLAEERFWACVQTGERPVADVPLPAPKPKAVREICLEGNNSWGAAAADWISCGDAARRHAAAVKSIKDLVEDDVSRVFGHGIEARRSKSGAITIREAK